MKNITTLLYEVLASLPTGDPDRDKIGSAKAARNSSLAMRGNRERRPSPGPSSAHEAGALFAAQGYRPERRPLSGPRTPRYAKMRVRSTSAEGHSRREASPAPRPH
jgi:hypothetical protein